MEFEIQGKTALVTGANRGIGKAIVEALIAGGAQRIYAAVRELASLENLVNQAPTVIVPLQLDITAPHDIRRIASVIDHLDLLINNAGIGTGSSFSGDQSLTIAANEMATNYFGAVNLTHALLPALRKSSNAAIVNISSIAGICNFPALGPYSASKAAMHSFTQGLRAELKVSGVIVQGVYPGPVDTRMAGEIELPKAATADVAAAIFDGLKYGVEDIFPDAFSQAMYQIFLKNPKDLEKKFAASVR